MHIPVIFEDSDILILDKPAGVVVHPFDFSEEKTVWDFLHEKYPEMFSIKNEITLQDKRIIPLGGIVHKLDRDTSGILIVAKNQQAFGELKRKFINHEIEKTYVALVEGNIERESFTIDSPLGRSKKEYKQSVAPKNPRGLLREAVTDVKVMRRSDDTTLVELTPRTGRTHQLRAHMASIGHPIVGDIAYGSMMKDSHLMLHAQTLSFTWDGERKTFEVLPPQDFR